MSNIAVSLEKTGTLSNLLRTIDKVLESKPSALTLLVAAGNEFSKETFDPILDVIDVPVSGGIFHKIIFKDQLLDKGSIIIAWYNDVTITNYKNIENTHSIKDLVGISVAKNQKTKIDQKQNSKKDIGEYLLFIDGAVPRLEENLDTLYKKIGFRATFAGAGAGSTTMEARPCIITNEGLLDNAMQTVATNHKSRITVTHGLQKQSGPHLVTSSKKTLVKTINFEPIISFYKKHHSLFRDQNLKSTSLLSFFYEYSIGIEKLDGDLLVRSPFRCNEDTIEYIGHIPEYSKIHILSATENTARDEVNRELKELKLTNKKDIDTSFIFSCASRDDIDSKGHSKEVAMLSKHLSNSKNTIGALSFGEIATADSRLLHLHNKSIVITQLEAEA